MAWIWEFPAFEAKIDKAIIYFYNTMMLHLYHYISITDKATDKTEYKKQYYGGSTRSNVQSSRGKGGKTRLERVPVAARGFCEQGQREEHACWAYDRENY